MSSSVTSASITLPDAGVRIAREKVWMFRSGDSPGALFVISMVRYSIHAAPSPA